MDATSWRSYESMQLTSLGLGTTIPFNHEDSYPFPHDRIPLCPGAERTLTTPHPPQ